MLLEKNGEIAPERIRRQSQSKMKLMLEGKSDALKDNIA